MLFLLTASREASWHGFVKAVKAKYVLLPISCDGLPV
jgi:hypothetical protein